MYYYCLLNNVPSTIVLGLDLSLNNSIELGIWTVEFETRLYVEMNRYECFIEIQLWLSDIKMFGTLPFGGGLEY